MEVCVVGAGSLGSLVGGLLGSVADVTLVGRERDVEAIESAGLLVTGELDSHVRPSVRTEPPANADVAIVAVKAYDTATVAQELAYCDLDCVVSLQNGLGNEETLADRLACDVLAGTCTYGARRVESGHVECTGVGEVALGPYEGGEDSEYANSLGELFGTAGFETMVAADMPRRLWRKLAVNAGINATTALADVENGALVDGPAGETARAATRETARVARTRDVALPVDEATTAVADVATSTAANTSSMRQDLAAGRRTEIDAINGAVLERAAEPVPVNETLCRLVRAWERERGLRE